MLKVRISPTSISFTTSPAKTVVPTDCSSSKSTDSCPVMDGLSSFTSSMVIVRFVDAESIAEAAL